MGFVIEVLAWLVIDYAICSKYCVECELVGKKLEGEEKEQWQDIHQDHCDVNHNGYSGSMETEAAKVMWGRQEDGAMNIFHMKEFLSICQEQRLLMSEVVALLQFILVIPATNATSERSFSALRCLKSYLRTTMLQERLMLMRVHKKRTDALDMQAMLTEFIDESEQ